MKITFLGTGTSSGVPQLGCNCEVCRSVDARDIRLRTSALVEVNDKVRILIDCGPDFRQQMMNRTFRSFQAVLITHEHYDHVGGIDDLRPCSLFGRVPLYADSYCAAHLRERLPYCFAEHIYPGVPQIELKVAKPGKDFLVGEGEDTVRVMPLQVIHGKLPILGYRIGDIAYITDATSIPKETEALLMDVPLLIVNALRHTPHHSHQTLEQAIAMSRKLRAKRTYFIHMSHQIGLHAEVESTLPKDMHLAYDGLEVII